MSKLKVGDNVWFPHEEHSWLLASIKSIGDSQAELITVEGGTIKCPIKVFNTLDLCGSHVKDDIANLVDLDELSEGAILHHVRKRFTKGLIYTHVGAILVAVNPFERLPIYGDDTIRKAQDTTKIFPHVFVTAAVAYAQVQSNRKNQSVLISGESGAGKTETTKKVLTYLATVAPGSKTSENEPGIEEKILQSNPLLEALGNAKTLRNNNSSRFGKYMKVDLDTSFRIQGCEIINYLLEKSRVTAQSTMERNYHIFYQLIMGVDQAYPGFTEKWGAFMPFEQYNFLNQSGCVQIEGVDDKKDFEEVVEALNTLQFTPELQDSMMRIITAVLIMGNVIFTSGSSEGSSEVDASSTDLVARIDKLLGFDPDAFHFALTMKRVQMGRGSVVSIKLTPEQALDSKDTLAKALYSNMFDWIIYSVNQTLKTSEAPFSVGILDIFGFEVFEVNSFEQLCINYANEKLQLHFNEVIFNEEMKMYEEEGIPSEHIDFVDNAQCVSLIEARPVGLLCLLDEESSLAKATDITYANKITQAFSASNPKTGNPFFVKNKTKPEAFSVNHFAGPVEYNVTNFLEKNKDTLSQTLREVAAMSTLPLVSELFPVEVAAAGGRGRKTSTKATLGGQFRNQLIGLIANLNSTEPHFIRCVKPNHAKKPQLFDGVLSLRQLRYAGLFEAIRIRQSGFAFRVTHKAFAQTYYTLVDGLQKKLQTKEVDHKEASLIILENAATCGYLDKKLWLVGKTRVFIKTNQDRIQLERQRALRVEVYAIRAQKVGRGFLARARVHKAKFEAIRAAQRALMENEHNLEAALLIQRVFRGSVVRRAMRLMADFVKLRKAMANRDVAGVEATLESINNYPDKDSLVAFEEEVKVAKTMVKLICIQDKYIESMNKAILTEDVTELNRLLVKCDRLDLANHPSVQQAKELLEVLHEKRNVMQDMVDFLKSDNSTDAMESVPEMLLHAEAVGVDMDFVNKVRRIYENTSPRLRARGKLRRAIEIIDKTAIEDAVAEVNMLQMHHEPFAAMELKAADGLLKMLELEACLAPKSLANFEDSFRLTDACLALCHDICACEDSQKLKSLVKTLKIKHAYGSSSKYESIIRSFKWSKVFCAWKYPEVLDKDRVRSLEDVAAEEAEEFFGLRPSAARQSSHVILSLHQDMDAAAKKSGVAPASLQAAMGALNMLTDKSPTKNDKFLHPSDRANPNSPPVRPTITTTSYKDDKKRSPRKGSTPRFKKKKDESNIAGRRTTYCFLPAKVEEQLLESRKLLKIQQKNISKARRRDEGEQVRSWK